MIPRTISTGTYTYNIVFSKAVKLNGEECRGLIDYWSQIIELSNKYSRQTQEQTFWHELVRAIEHQYNLDLGEDTVDAIATGLYGIMQNNGILPGQDIERIKGDVSE